VGSIKPAHGLAWSPAWAHGRCGSLQSINGWLPARQGVMSDRPSPLAYPAVRPLPYKTHRLATSTAPRPDRQTDTHGPYLPTSLRLLVRPTGWVDVRTYRYVFDQNVTEHNPAPSTWRAPNRSRRELYGEVPVICISARRTAGRPPRSEVPPSARACPRFPSNVPIKAQKARSRTCWTTGKRGSRPTSGIGTS